jgi:hypothetical protein
MGMSREELLATAVNMLAAAVDPSPLPDRPLDPKLMAGLDQLKAIAEGRRAPDPEAQTRGVQTLHALHARPPSARFTPKEAAAYLNATEALLRTWRWKKTGPPYDGSGRFVRYSKRELDRFMAA